MQPPSEASIKKNFDLLVAAALAGERCPQNAPHGPLDIPMKVLVDRGLIRSEVYPHNFRRVVIMSGEQKGKATAECPGRLRPYLINGVHVNRLNHRPGKVAP